MNYEACIRYLYALEKQGVRLDLSRMQEAVAWFGHPEKGAPEGGPTRRPMFVVHVGGTNGKGSVVSMLARIFTEAGYRTGSFTSPHLHRFVERIRIDGEPLGEAAVTRLVPEIKAGLEKPGAPELSFFETTTLLGFMAFRDAKCDVAVVEVGLGGRLDATSVVSPDVTVITRVALDHVHILGDTLPQIATEKAGIIRPSVPLVCGVTEPEARVPIAACAERCGAPVLWADDDIRWTAVDGSDGPQTKRTGPVQSVHPSRPELPAVTVQVGDTVLGPFTLGLHGEHQRGNAALVVATVHSARALGLEVSDAALSRGLAHATWPGRLELVAANHPRPAYLFDAAHNEDACRTLVAFLASTERTSRALIFGAMKDKDLGAMVRLLVPHVDHVICPPVALSRAGLPEDVAAAFRAGGAASVRIAQSASDAAAQAQRLVGPEGLVISAGSIFVMADVRAHVLGVACDPPIAM